MISYAALARSVGPHARDLALIVLASSAIFRLDPIADAHSPAAPVAVVAFPLLVATSGVLGLDILFEDPRLLLAIVICVDKSLDAARRGSRHCVALQ